MLAQCLSYLTHDQSSCATVMGFNSRSIGPLASPPLLRKNIVTDLVRLNQISNKCTKPTPKDSSTMGLTIACGK